MVYFHWDFIQTHNEALNFSGHIPPNIFDPQSVRRCFLTENHIDNLPIPNAGILEYQEKPTTWCINGIFLPKHITGYDKGVFQDSSARR